MNRNIFYWALYDFANSIIMIVFIFYFSQWIVIDSERPDWWYNIILIVSSMVFIVTTPWLARRLDITRKKLPGLRLTSFLMIVAHLAVAWVVLFMPQHVFLAAALFTIGASTCLLSYVYYTPMINDLATSENKSFVSGLGMGANYVGQVLGILAVLPFATGAWHLFGSPGRGQTLLPSVLLFALLSLPMLLKYREPFHQVPEGVQTRASSFMRTLRQIAAIPGLLLLIIAYFFFSDALLTFANNFPIYLEKVYAASDTVKTYLTAGILTSSAVGSVVIGWLADKKGKQNTLAVLLLSWSILFVAVAFVSSFGVVVILTLLAGFLYGPTWGVSRALIGDLTPRSIEASSFSLYTLAERFATFIGPITWSVVLALTAHQGVASYRYAILSMGALVVVGLFLVLRMRRMSI